MVFTELELFLENFLERPFNWHSISSQFIDKYFERFTSLLLSDEKGEFIPFLSQADWYNSTKGREFVLEYINRGESMEIFWKSIFTNEKLPDEFLQQYSDKPGFFLALKRRTSSPEFIEKFIDHVSRVAISSNSHLKQDFFERHPKAVFWPELLLNENITEQFLDQTITNRCRIVNIRPSISHEFLVRHSDIIDWDSLSAKGDSRLLEFFPDEVIWQYTIINPNLTDDFVIKFQDRLPITELVFCSIPESVTLDHIKNGKVPSANMVAKLSLENLERYFNLFNRWWCRNNNLTYQFVKDHYNDINWLDLCRNPAAPEQIFWENLSKLSWEDISLNPKVSYRLLLQRPMAIKIFNVTKVRKTEPEEYLREYQRIIKMIAEQFIHYPISNIVYLL